MEHRAAGVPPLHFSVAQQLREPETEEIPFVDHEAVRDDRAPAPRAPARPGSSIAAHAPRRDAVLGRPPRPARRAASCSRSRSGTRSNVSSASDAPGPPTTGPARCRGMIELDRPLGGVLRIGHRGAAALAPENTLRSFRAAVEVGVDLIEFDVLDLPRGPARARPLGPPRRGQPRSRQRPGARRSRSRRCARSRRSCRRSTRRSRSSSTRRPDVGLHVDLKLRTRLDELGGRDQAPRARAPHRRQRRPRAEPAGDRGAAPPASGSGSRIRRTGSRSRASRYLWPIVSLGLASMRASVPLRLPRLARRAGAGAVMLQHRLVTRVRGRAGARRGAARARLDGRRAGRPRRASWRPASTA